MDRDDGKASEENIEDLVKVELMADTDAIVPGREFLLGARFTIAPGWYIYHKNPGDAGLPTTVDFKLPDGFMATPVMYPDPYRFKQPGDILGFGYKKEVMLLIRVYTPVNPAASGKVDFAAHAEWLACKDKCIMGEKQLALSLPVAAQAHASQKELFGNWMDRISQ
jgi:thiol:disulfide interchange protein DsbD